MVNRHEPASWATFSNPIKFNLVAGLFCNQISRHNEYLILKGLTGFAHDQEAQQIGASGSNKAGRLVPRVVDANSFSVFHSVAIPCMPGFYQRTLDKR